MASTDRGPGSRVAVSTLAAALLAAVIVGSCGEAPAPSAAAAGSSSPVASDGIAASPSPAIDPSPTASSATGASPGASPGASRGVSPGAVAGFPDPYPGSEIVAADVLQGTSIVVHELLYDVPAGTDDIRAHYRQVLRDDGWRIGEVELDGTEWELEAVRGGDEIEVEIEPVGDRSRVEVTMSLPVAP